MNDDDHPTFPGMRPTRSNWRPMDPRGPSSWVEKDQLDDDDDDDDDHGCDRDDDDHVSPMPPGDLHNVPDLVDRYNDIDAPCGNTIVVPVVTVDRNARPFVGSLSGTTLWKRSVWEGSPQKAVTTQPKMCSIYGVQNKTKRYVPNAFQRTSRFLCDGVAARTVSVTGKDEEQEHITHN